MTILSVRRLPFVIEPEPGNPYEVEGVLNPAAARGRDGALYLFPRLVAAHNYSRIGVFRVVFDRHGDPCDVERLGVALEPTESYERRPDGGGGCEDPRVTFVAELDCYVMTYTAFSARGPRIAIAVSDDLITWQRLGLATFAPHDDIEFNEVDNKDATFFPAAIPDPSGQLRFAMLHRPLFQGTLPEDVLARGDRERGDHRESIWLSCSVMSPSHSDLTRLTHFEEHFRLAAPESSWESLKIGSGTPPVLTEHGWLLVYHGVSSPDHQSAPDVRLTYCAGTMLLSPTRPHHLCYRSPEPILVPASSDERRGTSSNVVFPTGLDRRSDVGAPDRFDLYYGMNDFRIEAARLEMLPMLPVTITTNC